MSKAPKYQIEEQYWVVSEVKASMIEVYNNFLSKQDVYVRSLKKVTDKTVAKAEYIASLYGFYTLMLNGFPGYLETVETKGFEDLSEMDFLNLALEEEHKDDKLIKMGYILQKWASTEGPFRITHQERKYNDPVEMLQDLNELG